MVDVDGERGPFERSTRRPAAHLDVDDDQQAPCGEGGEGLGQFAGLGQELQEARRRERQRDLFAERLERAFEGEGAA